MKKALSILILLTLGIQVFAQKQKRPNIIVILVDDMGYSDLGCMGSEIATPNLDQLAKNGVLFTNCYNTARCCPSRASLLTGVYQTRAGMGHMNDDKVSYPEYQGYLSKNTVTIAEALKESGYRTAMTGKWHVGDEPEHWPTKRGFERFYGIPAGGGLYFYPSKFLKRDVYLNDTKVEPEAGWYSTDAFTDYGIKFAKEAVKENKPFFMYMAYIAPHFPLQAKEKDIKKYENAYNKGYDAIRKARFERQKEMGLIGENAVLTKGMHDEWNETDTKQEARKMAVYAAMMDCLDQNIGRLKTSLKEMGALDNTVIMFLSDNGACSSGINKSPNAVIGTADSFVGYGQSWANVSNTPYSFFKRQAHEGGIITPLIVHWPKKLKKHHQIDRPVHINDILPTCLDLGKAEYPKTYKGNQIHPTDGKSFLRLAKGKKEKKDRLLYWEHEGNKAIRHGNYKLVRRYKKDWELYDLENDPTETKNIHAENTEKANELLQQYKAWKKEYGVREWPVKKKKKNKKKKGKKGKKGKKNKKG